VEPAAQGVEDSQDRFPLATAADFGLEEEVAELSDSLAAWVESGRIVGGELLVVTNDRTVWHEAAGWADVEEGRPLEPNSIFRIRSMTKPIVGTAVLMLQDDGLLAVSDRVSEHLPSFDNDRSRDVTIRQLLTHTSGFGNHNMGEVPLPRRPLEYGSVVELANDLGAVGPEYPVGTLRYSDSSSAILAALISTVSGLTAEDFIRTRIFDPLGMRDSHLAFAPDSAWADRLSSTYRWSAEANSFVRYWDPSREEVFRYFEGSGGVMATPHDFARFLAFWADRGVHQGERLLSEEAVSEALRPERGKVYGYQWVLLNGPPLNGETRSFNHGGSDGTVGIAIPSLDVLILLFTQSRGTPVGNWLMGTLSRMPRFAPFLIADFRTGSMYPEDLSAGEAIPAAQLPRYVGSFASQEVEGRRVQIWEHAGGLRLRGLLGENQPLTAIFDLIPVGGDRFRLGRVVDGKVLETTTRPPVEFEGRMTDAGSQQRFDQLRFLGGMFTRVQD
jgi:CubicO group peptidase (beta-lactamase class C family)